MGNVPFLEFVIERSDFILNWRQGLHYHRQSLIWAEIDYYLQIRQVHIDTLNNMREDIRDLHEMEMRNIDTSLIVSTLMLSIGFGFVVEGTYPPPPPPGAWAPLRYLYAVVAALSLITPFLGMLCYLEIRRRLEMFMRQFNDTIHKALHQRTDIFLKESRDALELRGSRTLKNTENLPQPSSWDLPRMSTRAFRQCCMRRNTPGGNLLRRLAPATLATHPADYYDGDLVEGDGVTIHSCGDGLAKSVHNLLRENLSTASFAGTGSHWWIIFDLGGPLGDASPRVGTLVLKPAAAANSPSRFTLGCAQRQDEAFTDCLDVVVERAWSEERSFSLAAPDSARFWKLRVLSTHNEEAPSLEWVFFYKKEHVGLERAPVTIRFKCPDGAEKTEAFENTPWGIEFDRYEPHKIFKVHPGCRAQERGIARGWTVEEVHGSMPGGYEEVFEWLQKRGVHEVVPSPDRIVGKCYVIIQPSRARTNLSTWRKDLLDVQSGSRGTPAVVRAAIRVAGASDLHEDPFTGIYKRTSYQAGAPCYTNSHGAKMAFELEKVRWELKLHGAHAGAHAGCFYSLPSGYPPPSGDWKQEGGNCAVHVGFDESFFFQVDINSVMKVVGFTLVGKQGDKLKVNRIGVRHSSDGDTWNQVLKTFERDADTVRVFLDTAFKAQYIRFVMLEWEGGVSPPPVTAKVFVKPHDIGMPLVLNTQEAYIAWKDAWCSWMRLASTCLYWCALFCNVLCCALLLGLYYEDDYENTAEMWLIYSIVISVGFLVGLGGCLYCNEKGPKEVHDSEIKQSLLTAKHDAAAWNVAA